MGAALPGRSVGWGWGPFADFLSRRAAGAGYVLGERSATMSRTGWEAAPPLLPLRRAPLPAVQGRYASAVH